MKLPLSREPRMRQMKKTISEAEEEIKHLKTISKTNRTFPPLSTPETSPTSSIGSTSSTDYSPSRATSAGSRSITRYPGHANQEVVSEMYSPTTVALALAKQLDITPRPHRVNALLPFTTTISCIKSARTTIKKALRRSENSNELPGKKDQIRGRGTFSLTDTMQNIYRKFCLEFSDIKMSFTAFCRGRPSNVKLIRYTQRHVCLCQRHTNMSLKAIASKVLPRSLSELTSMSDEDVRKKLNDMDGKRPIRYQQWMKKEVQYKTTLIKKVKLQEVVEDVDTFSQTLMRELPEFRAHCGRVVTQYEEVRHLRCKLKPMTEATIQMDYAENWQVKYMEEIESVYYDKAQITIHPMVLHYRNENGQMKVLNFVGLSCVTAHTVPTTFAFLKAMMSELHQAMPLLNTIHFVTDSPSSQYRNRSICALVGHLPLLFGVRASWAWLEAGHGKGPCDGRRVNQEESRQPGEE